ncbi:hypothetical protein J7337_009250 [Fusarium musae]|uniref:Uncharacterized protein n=1 Tax=Fusarium musae TaxID=1042133 RepID=A0A9P8DAP0_9HYPO|nr:hypothetical protein J7337_009250 [Fusarium musae]KAG9498445.1 hypothetical protein J7337_009250 [Fusarium musae]
MTSREVKERALLDRIQELEAELRETKARYAALEIKARDDAKKLADITSIVGSGMRGVYEASGVASGVESRRFESPAVSAKKSELANALQTVQSGQTDLTKTLQEENERLRQSSQAPPAQTAERSPTPVEASHSAVSSDDESSQQPESLSSYLARKPEGFQFPSVQSRFTITNIPSINGSMTERNHNIPNEPGWRDYLP